MINSQINRFIGGNVCKVQSNTHPDYFVHQNQINTAKEILKDFATDTTRWSILLAQPQSGKSGVYFSVAYAIKNNEKLRNYFKVDNIFLITGMNETRLYNQFNQDVVFYLNDPKMKNCVLKNSHLKKYVFVAEKMKANSLLSQREEAIKKEINKIRKNALIIIDESHYSANNDSKLHLFLTKVVGIEPIGNKELMKKQNVFVLSVSATPIAELLSEELIKIDETYAMAPQKAWRVLIPDKTYSGIPEMFKNNVIFQSKHIKKETIDEFEEILKIQKSRMVKMNKMGYVIVRCSNKEISFLENSLYVKKNWVINHIYNENSNIELDFLEDVPNKPNLVLIKGTNRAGIRFIGKDNIFMIRETPKSLSDTTAQGLLGRVCGYSKNKQIHVYCDIKAAEQYVVWKEHNFDPKFSPDARNITKIVTAKGVNKYGYSLTAAAAPLLIKLPNNIINKIEHFKGGNATEFVFKNILGKDTFKLNNDHKQIIKNVLGYENKLAHMNSVYQNVTSEEVRKKQLKPLRDGAINKLKKFTSYYMNNHGTLSSNSIIDEDMYTKKVKKYLNKYFISMVVDKINNEVVFGFAKFEKPIKKERFKSVSKNSLYSYD